MSAVIIVILLIFGGFVWFFMQRREYEVTRSKSINADLSAIHRAVVDFRLFRSWTPFLIYEPKTRVQISKKPDEVGSFYRWQGKRTGEGTLTHRIIDTHAIEQSLEFRAPFRSKSVTYWTFVENEAGGVDVTWKITGRVPFFLAFLAKKMDRWMGPDMMMGLDFLAREVDPNFSGYYVEHIGAVRLLPKRFLGLHYVGSMQDFPSACQQAFETLRAYSKKERLFVTGVPFVRYHCQKMFSSGKEQTEQTEQQDSLQAMQVECDVCIELRKLPPKVASEFLLGVVPGLVCSKTLHRGDYQHLGKAWGSAFTYSRMAFKNSIPEYAYEIYRKGPIGKEPKEWETEILLPLTK